MTARLPALLLALLLPVPLAAQGFAGLGSGAEGFALPDPAHVLTFPADHGAHPDFRIEWWYLTANLTGADGTDYGVQWTLFRAALAPGEGEGWASPQMWMGHAALTAAGLHLVDERLARGGVGLAGVRAAPFAAVIDDWRMEDAPCAAPCGPMDALALAASAPGFRWSLALEAEGPVIANGEHGYSVKSREGAASHYYSRPYRVTAGTLVLPEGEIAVTGHAWLDREWSSQPLSPGQEGWDWFTLRLESGAHLMAFRLREAGEAGEAAGAPFTAGTWVDAAGHVTALPDGAFTATPQQVAQVAGREIPVAWHLVVPGQGLDLTVTALNPGAWMEVSVPYWEGPVQVGGSHRGMGYLEMTGY